MLNLVLRYTKSSVRFSADLKAAGTSSWEETTSSSSDHTHSPVTVLCSLPEVPGWRFEACRINVGYILCVCVFLLSYLLRSCFNARADGHKGRLQKFSVFGLLEEGVLEEFSS